MSQFNGPIQNIPLIAPSTQTTAQQSPTQVNTCYKGLLVYLNITAASGTGGLTPSLYVVDPVSGASLNVANLGSAKTSTGLYIYAVYPTTGLAVADGGVLDYPLPANWFIKIAVGDATSYTYSLSADLLI